MLNKYFNYISFLTAVLLFSSAWVKHASAESEKKLANKIANVLVKTYIYENLKNNSEKGAYPAVKKLNKRLDKLKKSQTMKRLLRESSQVAKQAKKSASKGKIIKTDDGKEILLYCAQAKQLFRNIEYFFKFLYQNLQNVDKQYLIKHFNLNNKQTEELNKKDFCEIFKCKKCLAESLGFKEEIVAHFLENQFSLSANHKTDTTNKIN